MVPDGRGDRRELFGGRAVLVHVTPRRQCELRRGVRTGPRGELIGRSRPWCGARIRRGGSGHPDHKRCAVDETAPYGRGRVEQRRDAGSVPGVDRAREPTDRYPELTRPHALTGVAGRVREVGPPVDEREETLDVVLGQTGIVEREPKRFEREAQTGSAVAIAGLDRRTDADDSDGTVHHSGPNG